MKHALWGLYGHPYLALDALIDTHAFEALDREITLGLTAVDTEGTGATLKHMGVVAPWVMGDGYRDAMHAIEAMSDDAYADFLSLAEPPIAVTPGAPRPAFGDETERPLTLRQQMLLSLRHGVYFPWKVCYHFLANHLWDDKHSGEGKAFDDAARVHFPRTVAFIESLPFVEVGRAVLFGLNANDHAPLHRDTEPGDALEVAQSISFAPRAGKRFYLQNRPDDAPVVVNARAYWFNDMDYHGVLADPFFRYSIRVDGVFEASFAREVERMARRTRSAP
ncbi:MAG: hypothetical protein JNK72_18275 [Myxococcales bacterium]|nr:hypothetical protein [Myxococcales bacterium]